MARVSALVSQRSGQPIARQPALNARNLLSWLLGQAVRVGHLDLNPALGVTPERDRRPRLAEPYEQQRLLAVLPTDFRLLVAFAILVGLRAGEQFSLQLRDILLDPTNPHVVVRFGGPNQPTKGNRVRRAALIPCAPGFSGCAPVGRIAPTRLWLINRSRTRSNLLAAILEEAVNQELLPANPLRAVRVGRDRTPRTLEPWTALSPEEQSRLLGVMPAEYRGFVAFAMLTGLRAAEQLALGLEDAHLDAPTPHLVIRSGGVGKPTKTNRIRRVLLFPAAIAVIRAQLARRVDAEPQHTLFVNERGAGARSRGGPVASCTGLPPLNES